MKSVKVFLGELRERARQKQSAARAEGLKLKYQPALDLVAQELQYRTWDHLIARAKEYAASRIDEAALMSYEPPDFRSGELTEEGLRTSPFLIFSRPESDHPTLMDGLLAAAVMDLAVFQPKAGQRWRAMPLDERTIEDLSPDNLWTPGKIYVVVDANDWYVTYADPRDTDQQLCTLVVAFQQHFEPVARILRPQECAAIMSAGEAYMLAQVAHLGVLVDAVDMPTIKGLMAQDLVFVSNAKRYTSEPDEMRRIELTMRGHETLLSLVERGLMHRDPQSGRYDLNIPWIGPRVSALVPLANLPDNDDRIPEALRG